MKKVGIHADNYKVKKFKKELSKKGFENVETYPFNQTTTLLKIECEDSQIKQIEKICKTVELHFKRSN